METDILRAITAVTDNYAAKPDTQALMLQELTKLAKFTKDFGKDDETTLHQVLRVTEIDDSEHWYEFCELVEQLSYTAYDDAMSQIRMQEMHEELYRGAND